MKVLLFPFSFLYFLVTAIRNWFYNLGIFKQNTFEDIFTITVGNLSTGGTGKSPMICHLADLLHQENNVAILSRGYGRKTKGYLHANYNSTSFELGDEPMMFFKRFKNALTISVCEDRVVGIYEIKKRFNPNLVLLDDAYQHRAVKPNLNILLTSYSSPFYDDYILPSGSLREWRSGYKRADVIVVTKCPEELTKEKEIQIRKRIKPTQKQSVYFSSIVYGDYLTSNSEKVQVDSLLDKNILLITGIAKAESIKAKAEATFKNCKHLEFNDHHAFTWKDIDGIMEEFNKISGEKILLTTEKDFVRLMDFESILEYLYYWRISIKIEDEKSFELEIKSKIINAKKNVHV